MESLRAFAKVGLKLINNNGANEDNKSGSTGQNRSLAYDDEADPEMEFDLSSSLGIEIDDDAKLFHALNRFITTLNNRNKYYNSKVNELDPEDLKRTDPLKLSNKILEDTKYGNAYLAQLIRYNLIKYLRDLHTAEPPSQEVKNVLQHWWSSLLDLLQSDGHNILDKTKSTPSDSDTDHSQSASINERTNSNSSSSRSSASSSPNVHAKKGKDRSFFGFKKTKETVCPCLSIELISVIFEAMSRTMTFLMVSSQSGSSELITYSDSILRTIRIITTHLVLNSRTIKELSYDIKRDNHVSLTFCNNYNSLIRSFLGKLLAFAFFYLPDDYQFDTQIMEVLQPNFKIEHDFTNPLIAWKRRKYILTKVKGQHVDTSKTNTHSHKKFRVIISYIRHDLCYLSFYWHYWYIILFLLSQADLPLTRETIFDRCPGSSILIEHSVLHFLRNDLFKASKHLKTIRRQSMNANVNDSMPNSDIVSDGDIPKGGPNSGKTESLDEFIANNFKSLKIWNCLWSITKQFPDRPDDWKLLLNLHDQSQLKYIKKIPAYDFQMANIVYNKILKKLIETFDDVSFLNWKSWDDGYLSLLKTGNMNNQIIATLSLFNSWDHIPNDEQERLIKEIINDPEIWKTLTLDTAENLIQVLFIKLLVFKVSKIQNESITQEVFAKLALYQSETESLSKSFEGDTGVSPIERECANTYGGDSVLLFHVNKKFVLGTIRSLAKSSTTKEKSSLWRKNWIQGPLDINCKKEYNSVQPPPEFAQILVDSNIMTPTTPPVGFGIMLFPNMNKTIDYWNKKWSQPSSDESSEKELPYAPLEKLNTELFSTATSDSESATSGNTTATMPVAHGNYRTQYSKLFKFTKLFNLTMMEYYDFQNFEDDDNIIIDFELFQ